jgi:hypothetical protein
LVAEDVELLALPTQVVQVVVAVLQNVLLAQEHQGNQVLVTQVETLLTLILLTTLQVVVVVALALLEVTQLPLVLLEMAVMVLQVVFQVHQ